MRRLPDTPLPAPSPALLPVPPVVTSAGYVTPLPPGHRFPMTKFAWLRDRLQADGLLPPGALYQPEPAALATLSLAHDPEYVAAVVEGRLDAAALRRIGLPWSPALVTRSRLSAAGTLLTARLALTHGLALHGAGGTHHAFRAHGSGFCVFNDLAITARTLLAEGAVRRLLILDLDVHQGDGTAAMLADEPRAVTVSLHCRDNFPFTKQASDLDLELPVGVDEAGYLPVLLEGAVTTPQGAVTLRSARGGAIRALTRPGERWAGLAALLERVQPDLLLYDAGADVHRDDPLGRLALSDQGLYARDHGVIALARGMGIATACVIGGGYARDPRTLADRHAIVFRAAARVWAATGGAGVGRHWRSTPPA